MEWAAGSAKYEGWLADDFSFLLLISKKGQHDCRIERDRKIPQKQYIAHHSSPPSALRPQSPVLSPQSPVLSPQSSVPSPQSSVPSPQSSVPSPQSSVLSPQSPVPSPQSPVPDHHHFEIPLRYCPTESALPKIPSSRPSRMTPG